MKNCLKCFVFCVETVWNQTGFCDQNNQISFASPYYGHLILKKNFLYENNLVLLYTVVSMLTCDYASIER